jgi:hypothetical protein
MAPLLTETQAVAAAATTISLLIALYVTVVREHSWVHCAAQYGKASRLRLERLFLLA